MSFPGFSGTVDKKFVNVTFIGFDVVYRTNGDLITDIIENAKIIIEISFYDETVSKTEKVQLDLMKILKEVIEGKENGN